MKKFRLKKIDTTDIYTKACQKTYVFKSADFTGAYGPRRLFASYWAH
jgi:hypothetical protein